MKRFRLRLVKRRLKLAYQAYLKLIADVANGLAIDEEGTQRESLKARCNLLLDRWTLLEPGRHLPTRIA